MTQPSPAIVAQSAVRRLPRWPLLLLCAAYVLAGFIGRDPWKAADVAALGQMQELALGTSSWWQPTLMGQAQDIGALLPYWLGALAILLAPDWMGPAFAVRIPSMAQLALALAATWYGVYYLARAPGAQPVAFAFGGEARPVAYARALADGGLLALIACLGLAQFGHETTPSVTQLCATTLAFYGLAALPYRPSQALWGLTTGLLGLALSGAPTIATLIGLGGAAICLLDRADEDPRDAQGGARRKHRALGVLLLTAGTAALATVLELWRWQIAPPGWHWASWRSLGRLLLWFTWPIWPMAAWTLWRWRRQLTNGQLDRHFAVPLWILAISLCSTILTQPGDRSLLLGLPALAALAAFALPTFGRTMAALIDWFTLLFFSVCAITIWVIWISLQTGVPAKPGANVLKLAPGFEPSFSLPAFLIALAATGAWAWVLRWRTGRQPTVIWKSLVLPAGGTALCWMLLSTLGLAPFNYARSYGPLVRNIQAYMTTPGCVETHGLTRAQVAAFRHFGGWALQPADTSPDCPWLVVHSDAMPSLLDTVGTNRWVLVASVRRPADKDEDVLLFRRQAP